MRKHNIINKDKWGERIIYGETVYLTSEDDKVGNEFYCRSYKRSKIKGTYEYYKKNNALNMEEKDK